jgi:hypothetical protein
MQKATRCVVSFNITDDVPVGHSVLQRKREYFYKNAQGYSLRCKF